MITKYDLGETVMVKCKVTGISIDRNGVLYRCDFPERAMSNGLYATVNDEDIADGDFVTVETYESEINELKSIIEEKDKEIARLKNPYIKIKRKDFSHHPSENIYAKSLKNYDDEKEYDKEDWRLP